MKVESRLFAIIAVFCVVAAVVYGLWSEEVVGFVALILTAGLALIIWSYFAFVARRLEPRPEDDPRAEVSDGAGEMGFFSPGSYWPIMLAGAAGIAALGTAFYQWWLMIIGFALVLLAVGGLVFEYHTGPGHE